MIEKSVMPGRIVHFVHICMEAKQDAISNAETVRLQGDIEQVKRGRNRWPTEMFQAKVVTP